ncbi:hypothetical protein Tco_0614374, partial [Tanacetum coccineum]
RFSSREVQTEVDKEQVHSTESHKYEDEREQNMQTTTTTDRAADSDCQHTNNRFRHQIETYADTQM